MVELLKLLATALVPPLTASLEQQYIHRLFTSIGMFFMASAISTVAALSFGLLPAFFPGFAGAQELASLQTIQTSMLVQQLDSDIFQTRKAQCEAESTDAKVLYTQRLQDKLGQYYELRKYIPRVPGCDEFGVSAGVAGAR